MSMTKQEAIKLHREMWRWLAENPMKQKGDWPGWKDNGGPYPRVCCMCFCCEYAHNNSGCEKGCPLEFEPRGNNYDVNTCLGGLYVKWAETHKPEDRSRYAAMIRDLPERKEPKFKVGDIVTGNAKNCYSITNTNMTKGEVVEVGDSGWIDIKILEHKNSKWQIGEIYRSLDSDMFDLVPEDPQSAPKFKVGDKVVPIRKHDALPLDASCWAKGKKQGFLYIVGYRSDVEGERAYGCWNNTSETDWGDIFLESDLIPYIEPKFKKGDKVVVHGGLYGETFERWLKYNYEMQEFFKKNGYLYVVGTRDNGRIVCNNSPTNKGGDGFLPEDLTLYIEPAKEEPVGFKAGDRVRIRRDLALEQGRPFNAIVGSMLKYAGKVTKITSVSSYDKKTFQLHLDSGLYYWDESVLELVPKNIAPEDKIVVDALGYYTIKGNKTTYVVETQDGKYKGVAHCNPTDEWNEETGRKYALSRALKKMSDALATTAESR